MWRYRNRAITLPDKPGKKTMAGNSLIDKKQNKNLTYFVTIQYSI